MVNSQHSVLEAPHTRRKSFPGPNEVRSEFALDKVRLSSVAGHVLHGLCSGVAAPAIASNAPPTRQ